jgi:hypothetical protein
MQARLIISRFVAEGCSPWSNPAKVEDFADKDLFQHVDPA